MRCPARAPRKSLRTFGVAMLSCALSAPLGLWPQTATPLPEGKGKELLTAVCSSCHGVESVLRTRRTGEQWKQVVEDMVSNGAPLYDQEVEILTEYLAKNFGPEGSSESSNKEASKGKIDINKATTSELEQTLGLSAKESMAIVNYREKQGKFANWEDLKKVPGLDGKKMESKKDRLAF